MTTSKFDGMDRDELFNRYMVTRLGINRHMPMQDALLYILEELDRLHNDNIRLNSRVQQLENEMRNKLPQWPHYDPWRSPITYSSTTAGDAIDPNITKAIGTILQKDYDDSLKTAVKVIEEKYKEHARQNVYYEDDAYKKNFEQKF